MAMVVIKAAAMVLTAAGVPAGTVAIAAPIIGNALWYAGVTMGMNALAQGQVPDPESGKQSRRQPRPERAYYMGLASRGGEAYFGASQ